MDTMGALGLGIVLTLKDQVSAGLDNIRQKMVGFTGASQDMIKNFDAGAKLLLGGITSIVMGVKAFSTVKNVFSTSVSTAANFEQAMARVGAVSGTTGDIFNALANQAKELGAATQFSASQVASAQESLARAGFKALGVTKENNEIIAAIPGLLSMATAEGMELGQAADIASSAIRGFGMEATEAGRVADVLAKTSAASNTSIAALGESLKYVAPYAKAVGVDIEQTSAMLGVMANAGIKGTQAGNALKAAFVRLSEEPTRTAKALESLGVKAKTSTGDLRPLPELMKELAEKTKNMGKADRLGILNKVFGSIAGGGMLAIMDGVANGSLPELEKALYNCSGAAKDMADRMNATLQGAMLRLESATEGLRIAIGNHLLPVYTKVIDKMAEFKGWLTQLIEEHPILTKTILGIIGAFTTLIATVLIAVGTLATVGGALKLWKNVKPLITLALASIKTQAVGAMGALKGMLAPVSIFIALAGVLYYAWQKNLFGIRDMFTAISEGFKMVVNASEDGITEVSDMTYEALRRAGIWEYAVNVGKFFWRLRQFAEGFIEGIKEAWNTLKSAFNWVAGIFEPVLDRGGELLRFLGILKPLTDNQSSSWRSWGQLLGRIVPIILSVIAAFKGATVIIGIIKTITAAIALSGKTLLAHPVSAVITAIVIALILLYNHWDEVKEAFAKGVNFIRNVFRNIGKVIREAVTAAANWVKSNWQAVKNWWNSWTLKDIFAPIVNLATRVKNNVADIWHRFTDWWSKNMTLSNIFEVLLSFVDEVIEKLKGKWEKFKTWLTDLLPDWMKSMFGITEVPKEILERQETENKKYAAQYPQGNTEDWAKQYGGLLNKSAIKNENLTDPEIVQKDKMPISIISNPLLKRQVQSSKESFYTIETIENNQREIVEKALPTNVVINTPESTKEFVNKQVNNVETVREKIIHEAEKSVLVPVEKKTVQETNNNIIERVLPQIITNTPEIVTSYTPPQWNVANPAGTYKLPEQLSPAVNVITPTSTNNTETIREKVTQEIDKIIPVQNEKEIIRENNNNLIEKLLPQQNEKIISYIPPQWDVKNLAEAYTIPEIITPTINVIPPIATNNTETVREKIIKETEKAVPIKTERETFKEVNNNLQMIKQPPEVRETITNYVSTQWNPENWKKAYTSPEVIKENITHENVKEKEITNNFSEKTIPQFIKQPPEIIKNSEITRENLIRENNNTIEKMIPEYRLLTGPVRENSNGWINANEFNIYENFNGLTEKISGSLIDFNSALDNSFQNIIDSLTNFRLEQPQNNSPASKYLIQQNQNQANMNGAATVQAVQQTTENIVKVDNNFDVKISSTPVNINLDGERISSTVIKHMERHTLREGGGGRL